MLADFAATITIPGNGQRAFFLGELREFTKLPSPFQGLLKITSSAPIAVTSVRGHTNERGEFLITTTTPLDDSRPNPGSTFVPFFVDGGGYRTQFVLFGASGIGPSSGTLSLWNQDGVLTSIVVQ